MTGIILAHGAAQQVFDQNATTWSNWFDEMIVVCPEDDRVQCNGITVYPYGQSQHNGHWCCERFRYACELASTRKEACIIEYDTLLFGNAPKPEHNIVKGCGPMIDHDPGWYMHSPWILTQRDYRKISKYHADFKDNRFCDRWLTSVCDDLGIKPQPLVKHYTPPAGYTDDYREAIKQATIDPTILAFHGIKTVSAAKSIIFAKNRFTS